MVTNDLKEKATLVLASGAFDLVHYAHIRFLEEAKKAGGKNTKLIVVVARDRTVERLKGKKPVIPEGQRRGVVEALKPVNEAVLGYEDLSLEETISKIKPDIIALGYDQNRIENNVKKIITKKKLKIKIVRIEKFTSSDLNSSSKIKSKILKESKV
jgi:FAD synthetase